MTGQLIVVALGGNAISRPDQQGNVSQQFENSRITAQFLADLVAEGHQLVITHGNGPQIGNFLLRNEAAAGKIYPLPMEVAVAHVQGGMGFMIAETLTNELDRRRIDRTVSAVVTMIEVDGGDPSFTNPTKPIGQIFTEEDRHRFEGHSGWKIKEIGPGRFRRVVPSPIPQRILDLPLIRLGVEAGHLLVVCGGGGIPVVRDPERGYYGTAAVIDKDLAAALLAAKLGADTMMILTNVDRVSINYGKPDEREIDRMTVAEAKNWVDEGQFPPGSMGPKIKGAINFLEATAQADARVIIGPLERAADAVAGKTGTHIVKA